jgi:hypothetical protein
MGFQTFCETVNFRVERNSAGFLCARKMVLSRQKGLIRDRTYAVRLYDSQTLASHLNQVGFNQVKVHTNFSPHQSDGDYGFMNGRMIATGQKK